VVGHDRAQVLGVETERLAGVERLGFALAVGRRVALLVEEILPFVVRPAVDVLDDGRLFVADEG